jgi:hypothetical protein
MSLLISSNRPRTLLLSVSVAVLLAGCFTPGYQNAVRAKFPTVSLAQTSYCPGTQGSHGHSPTLEIREQYFSPDDTDQVKQQYVQQGWRFTGIKGTIIYIPPYPPAELETQWFTVTKGERVSLRHAENQSGTIINAYIFIFACSPSQP